MNQNPYSNESTSYGPNQPGGNEPNPSQYDPAPRAPGSDPNANSYPPPPYGQPPAGQGSNPSYPPYPPQQPPYPPQQPPYPPQQPQQYPPQQPSNPYGYPNANTPPPQPYTPGQYVPPVPPPQQPAPRRRSSARLFALIGLVVLVILAGIIAAIAIPLHNTQVANDNATATAHTQSTTVARTATSVALTNATATAQTVATATAIASTYPFSATAKLDDPLSDNSHGSKWQSNSNCTFTNGAYHAKEPNANTYYTCAATNTNFSDFTYQVTMQIAKGDFAGVTFRGDDANSKYYSFIFAQDGSYILFLYTSGTHPKTLKSGTASQFNTGAGQSNDIGVVARGSSISMYVNKQEIATVTDSTYSSGQIGTVVYNTGNAVEAVYSNVKVWTF